MSAAKPAKCGICFKPATVWRPNPDYPSETVGFCGSAHADFAMRRWHAGQVIQGKEAGDVNEAMEIATSKPPDA